jgi:hypothetical protein
MFWVKALYFSDLPYPGLEAGVIDNQLVTGL